MQACFGRRNRLFVYKNKVFCDFLASAVTIQNKPHDPVLRPLP